MRGSLFQIINICKQLGFSDDELKIKNRKERKPWSWPFWNSLLPTNQTDLKIVWARLDHHLARSLSSKIITAWTSLIHYPYQVRDDEAPVTCKRISSAREGRRGSDVDKASNGNSLYWLFLTFQHFPMKLLKMLCISP